MPSQLLSIPKLLDRLEQQYGKPKRPEPRGALEWIYWINAAYLVPDNRHAQAFKALREKTGLTAQGVLGVPHEALLEISALGGMHPERRVEKWISIAELVNDRFDGDLEQALKLPLTKARSALKKFPGVGDPGADKILLFTKTEARAAFDSNGLRVLQRTGHAREENSYPKSYRTALDAFQEHLGKGCPWLMRAHDLLRRHGQELCKNNGPDCDACPLAPECPSEA